MNYYNYFEGEYKVYRSIYENARLYITDILQFGVLTIFRDEANPDKGHDIYRIEGAILVENCKTETKQLAPVDINKEITNSTLLFMLSYNKLYNFQTQQLRINIILKNSRH